MSKMISRERAYDRKTFVPGTFAIFTGGSRYHKQSGHCKQLAIVIGVTFGDLSDHYSMLCRTKVHNLFIFETVQPSWFFKPIHEIT